MSTEVLIDLNRIYTAEEFESLPNDGNRYELIEGKLIMSPATTDEHGRIIDVIYRYLVMLDPHSKLGRVWVTTGFNLGKKPNGKDNVPEPDLGFIVANRVPPRKAKYLPYPDLAIEVWSRQSDLDGPANLQKAREKLQMYLNAGTQIAWGINPIKQEVEIYHQGQATPVWVLNINEDLEGENIIPGFKLAVRTLFEDEWEVSESDE